MVDLAFGATAMASIFAIVDPLGVVPFFSVLTEGMTPVEKQDIVSKACLTATITLGVFAIFGQWIFAAFGFTIPAFKVAVVPLGIPLLAGPGAITTVMIYMAHPVADTADKLFVFAGILASVLAAFFLLHYADRIFKRLGRTGTRAVGRVMGLLLAAIAIQFIIDGVFDIARMHGLPVT